MTTVTINGCRELVRMNLDSPPNAELEDENEAASDFIDDVVETVSDLLTEADDIIIEVNSSYHAWNGKHGPRRNPMISVTGPDEDRCDAVFNLLIND